MKFLTIVVLIGEHINFSNGYSSGPPSSACNSMIPRHGGGSQRGSAPYKLTPSSPSVRAGQTLSLELRSTGNSKFKGFFVQAYESGTNRRIGEFIGNSRYVLSTHETQDTNLLINSIHN